jgi:hypothetical protein
MMQVRLAHSHSAINMFETCAKRYYHQRVTKEVKDEGGEASKHGERVHKQLELRLKYKTPLPEETASYEPICHSIERAASSNGSSLITEHELTLSEKLQVTGWWDADAWLRAKLDVVIHRPPSALIFDWKTGKRKRDFDQLDLSAAMLLMCDPEIMEVRTAFIWLKDNKTDMNPRVWMRHDLPELMLKLLPRIRRIELALESGNWPAKPSGLCRYCPARFICEYARL